MDKALQAKGIANRKAVLGEEYVNKAMAWPTASISRSRIS